jgi:murein L,D-transpeptidase YafK
MSFISEDPTFKDRQLEHYTVFQAYRDNAEEAYAKLKAQDVNHFNCDILLRAFKFEEDLEVWAKNKEDSAYKLITTYKFCKNVGELGPKRKEGDTQIPEGFYKISKFNPTSTYFLSLKLNYPNASDTVFADKYNPGGMIFIHGGCNTVGCIPITDKWIKELYVFCVEAYNGGQEDIPIHMFPARLTDENFKLLNKQYSETSLPDFWRQLKKGYDLFEATNRLPRVVVSPKGEYFCFKG